MKCPSCGAEIGNAKTCDYCGSQISQEMQKEQERLNKKGCPKCGSSNITFRRENHGEVNGKKSKQIVHRTVGVCKDCGETWFTDNEVKKRKTWLWVLGWLFIFPLPLTILMLRQKNMNQYLKYGIIAAAWIVYVVFLIGSNVKKTNTTTPTTDELASMIAQITNAPAEDDEDAAEEQETDAAAETEAETEKETVEKTTEKKTEKKTGIRPEFKKALDDYEAFFDEYIDFMETYRKSDNPITLMEEYTEYMTKYSDAMQSMDEMGEEEMSDEETAYYLKVTTRINQKLAKYAVAQ